MVDLIHTQDWQEEIVVVIGIVVVLLISGDHWELIFKAGKEEVRGKLSIEVRVIVVTIID